MLLRLEMSSLDSQKTRVTQFKIKITVSRQYTVRIKTTEKCNRLRASLAKERSNCSNWSKKQNKISWQHFDFSQVISRLVGYNTSDERILFVERSNKLKGLVRLEWLKIYEKELHFKNFLFQQDDASVHKAKIVSKFFEEVLEWWANSSDLNPFEN